MAQRDLDIGTVFTECVSVCECAHSEYLTPHNPLPCRDNVASDTVSGYENIMQPLLHKYPNLHKDLKCTTWQIIIQKVTYINIFCEWIWKLLQMSVYAVSSRSALLVCLRHFWINSLEPENDECLGNLKKNMVQVGNTEKCWLSKPITNPRTF